MSLIRPYDDFSCLHTPSTDPSPTIALPSRSDMWVQETGDDEVMTGATAFGVFPGWGDHRLSRPSPGRGRHRARHGDGGEPQDGDRHPRAHSSVQLEGNETAEEKPSLRTATPTVPAGWCAPVPRPGMRKGRSGRRRRLPPPYVLTVEPEASFVD